MSLTPAAITDALSARLDWPAWTSVRAAVRLPHVLDLRHGAGRVVLLGMAHTHRHDDPALRPLVAAFRHLRPGIALAEGGRPSPLATIADGVGAYGEASLLAHLAAHARIPLRTLEPWRQREAIALWPTFGREATKLFYVLRDLDTWHRGHRAVPIKVHAAVLLDNLSRGGVCGRPVTVADLGPCACALLPALPDWRALPSSWLDPAVPAEVPWTHAAARASSDYRDTHLVHVLARLLREGRRALAVVGFTHTVMLAPVWRRLLPDAAEHGGAP